MVIKLAEWKKQQIAKIAEEYHCPESMVKLYTLTQADKLDIYGETYENLCYIKQIYPTNLPQRYVGRHYEVYIDRKAIEHKTAYETGLEVISEEGVIVEQMLNNDAEQLQDNTLLGISSFCSSSSSDVPNEVLTEDVLKVIKEEKPNDLSQIGFEKSELQSIYTLAQCAQETGFCEEILSRWLRAIKRKGQAILYGSPGTGKTFTAEKLAKQLIGECDGFAELIQFHSAYTYEDFIQGIRPQNQDRQLTYPLVPGRFLEFCQKAESRKGLCVLIIDEINRANLAQVFGELMYLLEYRDKKIRLAGSNQLFSIPENVRIIGTMNTADRSIALVDHALRRRFAFIELRPNYEVLRRYHEKKKTGFQVEGLIKTLERLNHAIADKHYEVGISYFLTENLAEELEDIWQMEIEPYLEEYFYDQLDKVDEFRWDKIKPQVDL
jgi:MoxR-like ATPase